MTENGIAPLPLYFNDTSRHFLAGSVSGMIAKYIEYPADTIKVRLQTEPGRFHGAIDCIADTYRRRGLFGFYRGIGAPLVGAIFENAIGFGAYSYISAALGEPDPRTGPIWVVGAAGGGCGAVISFLQTPLELIKCRMQSGLTQVRYRGTVDCLMRTIGEEGVRSVFRGLSSTLIREIPGSATYFIMYEIGVRAMCPDHPDGRGSVPIMLAGSMGGAGYWLAGYPADVIKSRQQTGHPGSFLRIAAAIYRHEGLKAFFKGLTLTLIRAAPANAAVFLVYEYALKYLP